MPYSGASELPRSVSGDRPGREYPGARAAVRVAVSHAPSVEEQRAFADGLVRGARPVVEEELRERDNVGDGGGAGVLAAQHAQVQRGRRRGHDGHPPR